MKSKLTIDERGNKNWRLPNGNFHKEDGPAVEYSNGDKSWYINGKWHREDGPAIEWGDGDKSWWINGRQYSEREYKIKIRSMKLKLLL